MPALRERPDTRPIYFYFGALTLLVYMVAPEYLLDIPTSYMLKNRLHAGAPEVSLFRLLTGIPIYVAFLFGLLRDWWNPFGLRDRGYFLLFAPLTAAVFVWMAISHLSYALLIAGMILAMASFRFILAAFQGLLALVGQEALDVRPAEHTAEHVLSTRHDSGGVRFGSDQRTPHVPPRRFTSWRR